MHDDAKGVEMSGKGGDVWSKVARWSGLVGMTSWVVGVAMIPLDAKLDRGNEQLTALLADAAPRLVVAALLAVLGGVLLVTFFVAVSQLSIGVDAVTDGLFRLAVAATVMTQTLVGAGGGAALVAIHLAAGAGDPALVALAWRSLWLLFLASGVPTIVFTVAAVAAMARAGLASRRVGALGWVSAGAHVVVLGTVAQSGAFAPDGIVAAVVPLTTVAWIVGAALSLPGRVAARSAPVPV